MLPESTAQKDGTQALHAPASGRTGGKTDCSRGKSPRAQPHVPTPESLSGNLEASFDLSASLSFPGVRNWFDERVREQADSLSQSAPPNSSNGGQDEGSVSSGEGRFSETTDFRRSPRRPQTTSEPYHPWKFGRGVPLPSPRSRRRLRVAASDLGRKNTRDLTTGKSNDSRSGSGSLSSFVELIVALFPIKPWIHE